MMDLKKCPLCGREIEVIDCTENWCGFSDYQIKCECGLLFRSQSTAEHYWEYDMYRTPKTEESKKKAFDKMVEDWNNRSGCEQC